MRTFEGKIIHILGAIIHGHKSPLVKLALAPAHHKNKVRIAAQTINADVYLEQILKGSLVKAVIWAHHQGLEPLVLEDGAGPHRIAGFARVRRDLGISNLKHPGCSPDLNVIENCWDYVKDRIRRMTDKPSSEAEIRESIQKHWNAIPQDLIDGWNDGMEDRRLKVVAAKGLHIKA